MFDKQRTKQQNKVFGMECVISFSEQEMPPYHKPRSFQHKAYRSDSCEVLNDCKNSTSDTKVIEESAEKQQNTVESNKPAPEASETQCIPKSLPDLSSNLTELELSNQNFTDLPNLFKSLGNLKKLYIHDCALSELPDSIGDLKNLHDLNLSQNELKKLPEIISNLKHLEKLILCHNQLERLPSSFSKLQLLRELDLSHNKFQRLPKCLCNGMGTLRVLNISDNPHVRVNIMPSSKYLEKFLARNNGNCGTFPDWILCSKFFNMKEFDMNNTNFDIYTFNGKDGNLYYKKLSMASSNLSSSYLDMMMEHMTSLQSVNVGNDDKLASGIGNCFNYLPVETFRSPKLITELNFRGTGLATVPNTINQLCNLKVLDLGMNNISWFPDQFCELKKLKNLKIDGNSLILFPDNVGDLKDIQEIHAENNSVQSLPKSLENLKNLRLIDLNNNKFNEIPEVLCKLEKLKGLDIEINYFATTDKKIGEADYAILREYLLKEKGIEYRNVGVKKEESEDSCSLSHKDWFGIDGESGDEKDQNYASHDSEENWDSITDSDDEFEPNSAEINYNERSKGYLKANFAPLGFCPADLHSESIKKEVASMRVYGSMPSYKTVEGQFDDA